jgi:hypothetical protein
VHYASLRLPGDYLDEMLKCMAHGTPTGPTFAPLSFAIFEERMRRVLKSFSVFRQLSDLEQVK